MRTPALRLLFRPLLFSCVALFCLPLSAQTNATGTIRGRVLNAATHEYVRNAEIRVEGTPIVVYSTDGGAYTVTGVPAGSAIIVADYSGLQLTKASVNVAPGQTATYDFSLPAAALSPNASENV